MGYLIACLVLVLLATVVPPPAEDGPRDRAVKAAQALRGASAPSAPVAASEPA